MPQNEFVSELTESQETMNDYVSELENVKSAFNNAGKFEKVKKFGIILSAVLLSFFLFLFAFKFFTGSDGILHSPIGTNKGMIGDTDKIQNPITGELFDIQSASVWKDIRPLSVMVNNHIDARPQSGLIYADLVYEIVAEGGITRFLAFFNSSVPEKIGPVRSTREYYLVLVKELGDSMLMHIGWSPQALEAIETWPVRSLGRGGGQFWRDNPRGVAIEHTAYTNGKDLIKTGLDLGWAGTREFKVWEFKDDMDKYSSYPSSTDISIDFWYKGDYSAIFKYDVASNEYFRYMGYDDSGNPIPHLDQDTTDHIKVKNLIVQFVTESSIDDDEKGRLEYALIGSGKGIVFIDGKSIDVTWNKTDRDSRTVFYDLNGNEIKFNRGRFWISIVPDRNVEQVVYN